MGKLIKNLSKYNEIGVDSQTIGGNAKVPMGELRLSVPNPYFLRVNDN